MVNVATGTEVLLAGYDGQANAVNDAGTVVGGAASHATAWYDNGGTWSSTTLDSTSNSRFSSASAINASGTVVGYSGTLVGQTPSISQPSG